MGGQALPRCRPSTATRAGSSAGRWPSTCAPSSSSRRSRWPSGSASPHPGPGRATTTRATRSTRRWSSASRCRKKPASPYSMGAAAARPLRQRRLPESFFASLKKERIRRRSWPTPDRDAQTAIFAWIEGWYNRHRLHSTPRLPLAHRLREQNSERAHGASLAASRLASINKIRLQVNINGPSRLTTPCPRHRGRSSLRFGFGMGDVLAEEKVATGGE